jgi:hypothetical protein
VDDLIERLHGRYAVGKGDPPEFGFRQFEVPAIQLEAAAELDRLRRELAETREIGPMLEQLRVSAFVDDWGTFDSVLAEIRALLKAMEVPK